MHFASLASAAAVELGVIAGMGVTGADDVGMSVPCVDIGDMFLKNINRIRIFFDEGFSKRNLRSQSPQISALTTLAMTKRLEESFMLIF